MSGTRKAKPGSRFRQERFASAAKTGALLGNLVAKKCEVTKSAAHRRLILFLADLSLRAGLRSHPTCNLQPAWQFPWPDNLSDSATAFERVAADLAGMYPEAFRKPGARKRIPSFLVELCLNPAMKLESAQLDGVENIVGLIETYRAAWCTAARRRVVHTSVASIIWDALDYSLQQGGGMVICEGTYRAGKSYSAQAWIDSHAGNARYAQLSSSRDDTAFYREIARALGVSSSGKLKSSEMRTKIEAMLRTQSVLLVIDEAQYIWPQAPTPKCAPERANWLMTALLNAGVPVALIASKEFARRARNVEERCRYAGLEQFWGRVRLRKKLPDELAEDDLLALARFILPGCTEPMAMLLAGWALKAKGRISAIESISGRARYFADRDGRQTDFDDLEHALAEAGDTSAAPARSLRRSLAVNGDGGPDLVAARASESSPIPTWPGMFAGSRGST